MEATVVATGEHHEGRSARRPPPPASPHPLLPLPQPRPGDLSYKAAAADRAAKIADLVGELESVRADRDELARRVDKLERRVKRASDKLERRTAQVRRLRGDQFSGAPGGLGGGRDTRGSAVKRLVWRLARWAGLRA